MTSNKFSPFMLQEVMNSLYPKEQATASDTISPDIVDL